VGKRLETVPDPTSVFYHLPASEAHPQVRHGFRVKYGHITSVFYHLPASGARPQVWRRWPAPAR